MAWRFVIEGDGDAPPSIKPWLRSVLQGGAQLTVVQVAVGTEPSVPSEDTAVVDLLPTITDGD